MLKCYNRLRMEDIQMKDRTKLTINDIASMSGVSKATVSRVINNTKPVSNEVRQKVMQVIKDTGYKPSFVARSLINKETNIIGVIVPDISHEFCSQMVQGVVDVSNIYNYTMILCNTFSDYDTERQYLEVLSEKEVDGIIFLSYTPSDYHADFFENYDKPVVTINRKIESLEFPNVDIDNFNAGYEGAMYFIDGGHERIAFIGVPPEDLPTGIHRLEGFKKALKDSQIVHNPDYIKLGDYRAKSGYDKMAELMALKTPPTAVFCMNDEMAAGAISYCLKTGIKVPEEVSVMGFDNGKIAELFVPHITTLKQPAFDMGAVAMRLIAKLKENKGKKVESEYLLPYEIITRDSTRRLK